MMRWLLFPALALALGAVLAVSLRADPGYVLIQIAGYTLESSLAGLALLGSVAIALAVLAWRLFERSVHLPARVVAQLEQRRVHKAREQLQLGLSQLAAGQWDRAEVELLKRISDSDSPATNYLYAAEAAHQLAAPTRRDEYLQLARRADSGHQAAVLLQQAQHWADDGRCTEALMALDELTAVLPRHAPALRLRLDLLTREARWEALKDTAEAARGILPDAQRLPSALLAHRALLSRARASGQLEALRGAWQAVEKPLRHDADLLCHYALLLHDLNADAEGLRLIAQELKKDWNGPLVLCFGELEGEDLVRQQARVEEWLKQYGEKPELLLVAGRLCLRNRLWGRARSYFEACLRLDPSPELRWELGKLLLQQGEDEAAALEQFRQGLESSLQREQAPQQLLGPDLRH